MNETDFLEFTAKELLVDADKISLSTIFRDLPRWSSLNALIYVSRIKEKYNVMITSQQLASSKSLGDIYMLIQAEH